MSKKTYVSVGGACDPRIHISKKLGLTKKKGYKTCPFDLDFSTVSCVTKSLRTDFKDFFTGLHLIDRCPMNCQMCRSNPGKKLIANGNGFIFEHESPTHSSLFGRSGSVKGDDNHYIRNNYRNLRERFENRIANFRELLENNDEVVIVGSSTGYEGRCKKDMEEILSVLKVKYPKTKFDYILL